MSYWGYSPRPKHVKNGIKLQSGKISRKWWSDKWLSALESFGWKSRFYRGLDYARKGQVIDLKIKPGLVTARIQGTRSKPYKVSIKLEQYSDEVWEKVISVITSSARYIAKLLMGEMPEGIEEAFLSAGVKLFPENKKDIVTKCSCPDPTMPCKHIAAMYFVLAEEFDRNPFMLFHIRGRSRKDILGEINRRRSGSKEKRPAGLSAGIAVEPVSPAKVEPLSSTINRFWESGREFKSFKVSIDSPRVNLALLKRLGPPVFCDREKFFWSLMKRVYRSAGEEARIVAMSDDEHETITKERKDDK